MDEAVELMKEAFVSSERANATVAPSSALEECISVGQPLRKLYERSTLATRR